MGTIMFINYFMLEVEAFLDFCIKIGSLVLAAMITDFKNIDKNKDI